MSTADESNPNLLELSLRYTLAAGTIAEYGGDLDHPAVIEALAEMDQAEGSIHRKVDAIRAVMNEFETQAEARKREGDLRIERARALMKTVKAMEQWAIRGMEAAGLDRAGSIIPLSVCHNGGRPSVKWTRVGEPIPDGFRRVKTETVLDVEAVYETLAIGGELPPGIEVEPRGKHLRVALGESRKSKKGR
jgi:hypothetical protein